MFVDLAQPTIDKKILESKSVKGADGKNEASLKLINTSIYEPCCEKTGFLHMQKLRS